eukprot:CAMPEP_0194162792 /NCGR_PEP_ID=MMETSP0152-20130528/79685_1 /TAXON_ID=1049557 /ORGANISM="Thalassiothrix antarctica, Strain L6-D1" /LENGTH=251 /DNA_ID=CAMNT_0038872719 /DNA_START=651 /DNA_END=1402 /DNA_ORIENTATION=+
MDNDNDALQGENERANSRTARSNKCYHESSSSSDDDSDYHDESDDNDGNEVLEMVVKSQTTLLRERHNRALAAGAAVSLTNTTTVGGGSSTMRSTFQSISSSVTTMRNTAGSSSNSGRRALTERSERSVILSENSTMIQHSATRMVLDGATQNKFIIPPGEKVDGRKVQVSLHPFAQGGLRNVYHMKQGLLRRQVAKESRYDTKYQERLRFHTETSKCQARAMAYARQFNNKIKLTTTELVEVVPKITFLR